MALSTQVLVLKLEKEREDALAKVQLMQEQVNEHSEVRERVWEGCECSGSKRSERSGQRMLGDAGASQHVLRERVWRV